MTANRSSTLKRVTRVIAGVLIILLGLALLALYGVGIAIGCAQQGSCGWSTGKALSVWVPSGVVTLLFVIWGARVALGGLRRHQPS